MANRRMFSADIVSSDAFLDMGHGAQCLYFHLGMRADDDGFVNPKSIMRMLGVPDDELKVLVAKRFLLPFESGVVVVKHWLIHNLIRADLYHETQYKKEKSMLGLNDSGAYTELREGVSALKQIEAPKWLKARRKEERTANVPQTALRLGKGRVGKVRKNTDSSEASLAGKESKFNPLGAEIIKALEIVDPKNKNYYGNTSQRAACDFLLKEYGLEEVLKRISVLPKTNKTSFFPNITTPVQLRDKWVQLQDAADRRKSAAKIKSPVAFV